MLASQVYCRKCCYKYPLHLDTFDTISLVIPNNIFGVPLQLQDCLNKFVSNEIIHEVICERCPKITSKSDNYKSAFVKKLNFAKMPQLLCLHIQRLVWLNNGQPLKRCEHITFPEYLDMDSYVYQSQKSSSELTSSAFNSVGLIGGASTPVKRVSRPTDFSLNAQLASVSNIRLESSQRSVIAKYKYKLCSVIVHLGDASSGHFICYRRGTQKHNQFKWFYTSDTNVLEVSLSEVLNSSAYMLFYERIKNNH
jgi:ubiquitin carboxyl-terminal hydrolase 30